MTEAARLRDELAKRLEQQPERYYDAWAATHVVSDVVTVDRRWAEAVVRVLASMVEGGGDDGA